WGDCLPRRPNGDGGDDRAWWQRGRLPGLRRLRLLPLLRPVLAAADRVLLLPAVHVALVGTRSLGRWALPRSHPRPRANDTTDNAPGDKAAGSDDCLSPFGSAWWPRRRAPARSGPTKRAASNRWGTRPC